MLCAYTDYCKNQGARCPQVFVVLSDGPDHVTRLLFVVSALNVHQKPFASPGVAAVRLRDSEFAC